MPQDLRIRGRDISKGLLRKRTIEHCEIRVCSISVYHTDVRARPCPLSNKIDCFQAANKGSRFQKGRILHVDT